MMPTKRISDLPVLRCGHPEHEPPRYQVFKPGVYEHTCPACGTEQRFIVDFPSWADMPLGTRAHSSIGGYWERVPSGWRAQSGCVFPTPGGDATHVSYPDTPELHIPVFAGRSLAEARIARLRACSHTDTIRGANIPLRYGSCRSEVCLNCGAFRERDHHGNLRSGAWQPASEYADAIAEQEEA